MGKNVVLNKILITGGFGFLGSRLADYLSKQNNQIFIVSRNISQKKIKIEKKNIIVRHIDWDSEKSLLNVCKNIDIIIHCAGIDARTANQNIYQSFEINFTNTVNLLKAAEHSKVKKLFFISTIQVYGEILTGNIRESTGVNPQSIYALSKKITEDFLLASNLVNIHTKSFIFRLSNCFGAPASFSNKHTNLVVYDFCRQAICNNEILVRAQFNFVKNYITASDFCNTVSKFLNYNNPKKIYLYNLGGGSISILLLLKRVVSILTEEKVIVNNIKFTYQLSKESFRKFNYKTDKIKRVGIQFENNFDKEVRDIINFIKKENKN
jgi:UDP-glucose 4-epimerase